MTFETDREKDLTIFTITGDMDYDMAKVYQAYAEIEHLVWKAEVFRSMDEAYVWSGISQDATGEWPIPSWIRSMKF